VQQERHGETEKPRVKLKETKKREKGRKIERMQDTKATTCGTSSDQSSAKQNIVIHADNRK